VTGTVTVAVFDDGTPQIDRWVVFQDADGNVITSSRSDASGKASANVPDGSIVTVAYGTSVQHLVTVMGVQRGETIVIGEAEDEGEAGKTVATANVRLASARTDAVRHTVTLGVAQTEVREPSEALAMPVLERFLVEDPAKHEHRFRVLAEAIGKDGAPVAFAFTWGALAGADAGAVDVPLPSWSTAYRPFAVELANPPSGAPTVTGELAIIAGEGSRFERRAVRGTANATLRFLVPEPLVGDAATRLEVGWEGSSDRTVLTRRGKETRLRIDLASELLPRVSAAEIERSADTTRPVVRWSVAGDVSKSDAIVVRLAWPKTREHIWTIVAPPTTRPGLRPPALPEALAAWRPDRGVVTAAVAVLEASGYASYDDVRRKGIDAAGESVEDDPNGSLRWSATGDLAF
jgi:hypothetical protein